MQGIPHAARENQAPLSYLPDGNPGPYGGGTYNGTDTTALQADYENIFGPAARDIKFDPQRQKRHQRWHLPDVLKGPNMFLTDRVDGLITDTTNSPFTSVILPYVYLEHPDAKIKWNVWSFDEGLASRAPYESGARVLTQTKRSYAGYTVRQAIGIRMEHNFMRSPEGITNFQRQLKQLVGSIQYGNDLDVHMALVSAPSHAQVYAERYYSTKHNPIQLVRKYVDLFGIMQKVPNALDLLIEESKQELTTWGAMDPTFLLLNGKLTMQLQMSPERTNYVTQGIDGVKRLRQGPNIDSYRGLSIIKSRAFSLETGAIPRDILRRRVRVAEYYRIPAGSCRHPHCQYEFYDQSKDSWFRMSWEDLYYKSILPNTDAIPGHNRAPPFQAQATGTSFGNSATESNSKVIPYKLKEWSQKQYNAKVGLLPSMASTVIHNSAEAAGSSGLALPAMYIADEEHFAQTITQGANIMETEGYDQAHIDASAWFGGGLFSDTTYHLVDGHRAQFPLCNWAALDSRRATCDTDLTSDNIDEFIYAVNNYSTDQILQAIDTKAQTLGNSPDNVYLKRKCYVAYRPNAYTFTWTGAHSASNLPRTPDVICAGLFANTRLSQDAVKFLWTKCPNVTDDMVASMYRLMVPVIPFDYTDDNILNDVAKLSDRVNPWRTVLMTGLGAYFHPDTGIREQFKNALAACKPGLENSLMAFVRNAASQPTADFNALGAEFDHRVSPNVVNGQRYDTDFVDLSGPPNSEEQPTYGDALQSVSLESQRVAGLFFLIAAKRMFCGAARFTNGGDAAVTGTCGLSLLSREFASIQDMRMHNGRLHTGLVFIPPHGGPLAPAPGQPLPPIGRGQAYNFINPQVLAETELVIMRPNIEHNMLGVIMGRGGVEELGATFWGQTELNCFDDAEHGLWGMNYKYHERAQVMNEKNMIRVWDIAFDGYNGGMDDRVVDWFNEDQSLTKLRTSTLNVNEPYDGPSMFVMSFRVTQAQKLGPHWRQSWPNPIVFFDTSIPGESAPAVSADPEQIHKVVDSNMQVFNNDLYHQSYRDYIRKLPDFTELGRLNKPAGAATAADETQHMNLLAFQGHMIKYDEHGVRREETQGAGHLGPCYTGVASIREGKGYRNVGGPALSRLI